MWLTEVNARRASSAHTVECTSSVSRAQSQDPQSPQPIRGYTGELDLLVGGANYSYELGQLALVHATHSVC